MAPRRGCGRLTLPWDGAETGCAMSWEPEVEELRRREALAREMGGDNMARVPVVAACLGPVAGLGAARVVTSHFSVMVKETAQLFVAGPPVVRAGMGRDVDKEELGGWQIHYRESGAVDNLVETEDEALTQCRRFLSYLPASVWSQAPHGRS